MLGRYAIFDRIAAGGMATIHLGRLLGHAGFARTVAIKRLHPHYALDPEFVEMFLDEARLAARIRHPNVVPMLDVITSDGEPFLVMEYVEGESLSTLLRTARLRGDKVACSVAAGVMVQMLHGLHAAHDALNDHGEPLEIVHRDVSPQNVLVGTHGLVSLLDFGVAKAFGKFPTSSEGRLTGKLGYLSPEQVLGQPATRRSDIFAAAVVLWEMLAGRRLFEAHSEGAVLRGILQGAVEPPSALGSDAPPALEAVVMRALSTEPADRYDTALALVEAIEAAGPVGGAGEVARWLHALVDERLLARARLVAAIESCTAPSRLRRLADADPPGGTASFRSLDAVAGNREGPSTLSAMDTPPELLHPSSRVAALARPGRRAIQWVRWFIGGALLAIVAAGSLCGRIRARTRRCSLS